MILEDAVRHAVRAIASHRQRSLLTMLGIVIGVSSVILLTSIGEGTRLYMLEQFSMFGTNLASVNPGKAETSGMPGIGGTLRPLTLADAEAIDRLPGVEGVVPVAMGAAAVQARGRSRNVFVYGVTEDVPRVWSMNVRVGTFLPGGDTRHGAAVAVLGPTLKRELFGEENALGEHVRIAGERFLVVGVMESKGRLLGFDIDDSAYIPVSRAMALFNMDDLVEMDVLFSNASRIDSVAARMTRLLIERHGGDEDFTVTTQTGMLETLDRILGIVSLAVTGIAAISLVVGGIGILTMMWISVNERTAEIGLEKALGATPRQILALFLLEAATLGVLGGLLGLGVGVGLAQALRLAVPGLPVSTPIPFAALAVGVSLAVGLLSGALPARRAARLDPVEALGAE